MRSGRCIVLGILKCDHSNDSYWAVLNCAIAHYAVLIVVQCWESLSVAIQMIATQQYLTVLLFIILFHVVQC